MSDVVPLPHSESGDRSSAGELDDSETLEVSVSPQPAGSSPTQAGATVSRYVVLEEVGRGGMGRVLRAYDPKLQREVALKEVRRSKHDADTTQRLVAEARAMAKLSHPNVVEVFDVETLPSGEVILVMEFVAGETLKGWLRREERGWRDIVARFTDAGQGLLAAHEAGLLHRDFKPANVLVATEGTVKVTDFGLAKASASSSHGDSVDVDTSAEDLTQAGTVVGTPRFMAPEQHAGETITPATDQYAFCVALWQALCGQPPFSGRAMVRNKRTGPPSWPNPDTPGPIVDAVVRGLSPDPDQRWPSMSALLETLASDSSRWSNRWLLAVGGLGAVSLAGLAYEGWSDARAQRCTGAEAQLAGIWDDVRRAEVRSAFEDVGKPYALDAWTRAERALDAYAQGWTAMHVDACESTTVRREHSPQVMDLRMACLRRRSVDLQATVDTLAEADAEVVQKAHDLTGGLRSLDRCADTAALSADVDPPSAQEAEAVEAARVKLARASSLRTAGRYAEAKQAVEAAAAILSVVEYEPVQTEVALARGTVLQSLGEYDASETALEEVLRSGTRWGQWDAVREAAVELMHVVGHQQKRLEAVLRYRPLAEGLSQDNPVSQAAFRNALGLVLHAQGKHAEAEAEHRAALAIRVEALGPDHAAVADSRNNLAIVLGDQGKYAAAETEFRAALKLRETILGAAHPNVAASRNNLAVVLEDQGKYADAEAEHRAALALWEAAVGTDHPHAAVARNNLANALRAQGRYADAEAEHRAALALFEKALGPEHPNTASSRNNLANALQDQKKYAEAEAEHRVALAVREKALGVEHPNVATSRNNLGNVLALQRKFAEAESELRVALALWEATLGTDHPAAAQSRHNLSMVLLDLDRSAEALPLAELSWARREQDDIPVEERGETAFLLAKLLWTVEPPDRDRARARTLARDALASYKKANGARTGELRKVRQWVDNHLPPRSHDDR